MKLIIFTIIVTSLSGCSSLGQTTFSCGEPEGTTCISTYDIYDYTHGGNNTYDKPKKKVSDTENATKKKPDDLIREYVVPNLPNKPIPIRTPSKIMRIWIGPWEDKKSGAFITPGYLYTEIEPRTWVLSEKSNINIHKLFTPLIENQPSDMPEKQP